MPHKFVVAIHQTTTGTRLAMVDRQGQIVAEDWRPLTPHSPHPDWLQYDPEEIWRHIEEALPELIQQVTIDVRHISAIGIAAQRDTTVLWDRRTGRPVSCAIAGPCQRSRHICERLRAEGLEATVKQKTGLPLLPDFPATKIRWALENVPEAQERADAGELLFGTVDTWLAYNLTGGRAHITDHTHACRTLLYNLETKTWDAELLHAMQIPGDVLPAIRSSSEAYAESSGTRNVPAGLLLGGMAANGQAALFGQGCHFRGSANCTYGRACQILLNTGQDAVAPTGGSAITTACGPAGEPIYALEAVIPSGALVVEWLRHPMGLIANAEESAEVARSVPDSGGVCFVPALTGLGPPHQESDTRGTVVGLKPDTSPAHLVRAALEGIAHQCVDALETMAEEVGVELAALRADGPASGNDFLMQFQADLLNLPVEPAADPRTELLGAAFLAGLASGFWLDAVELAGVVRTSQAFRPQLSPVERGRARQRWREALGVI
ncbi:MAG: FGGY family carbohydrate kinase [Armatimonadota bacterium]